MTEQERTQEAINWLKIDRDGLEFPLSSPDALNRDYIEIKARVLDTALSALRAQEQNEPLTFEQLLKRVNKPVWVDGINRWEIINVIFPQTMEFMMNSGALIRYGYCNFYINEPKGADQ